MSEAAPVVHVTVSELAPDRRQQLDRALSVSALPEKITTHGQYAQVGAAATEAARMKKSVEEFFDPLVEAAHKPWKLLTERRKTYLDEVKAFLARCDALQIGWDREQRRIAAEEAAKQQEALRKKAEEQQLNEALAAESRGDVGMAEAIMDAPTVVKPTVVKPLVQKLPGTSVRENWTARVTDLTALVKHVAANPRDMHLVTANVSALGQMARTMKRPSPIPGVVFEDTGSVARRV